MSTTKLTAITRPAIQTLAKEAEELLAPLAEKYGVSIDMGRHSFTSKNVTLKINVSVVNEDGVAETPEAEAFKVNAPIWGLKSENLHDTFKVGGKVYKIVGAKPRATKYPILGEDLAGKRYKFAPSTVKFSLSN